MDDKQTPDDVIHELEQELKDMGVSAPATQRAAEVSQTSAPTPPAASQSRPVADIPPPAPETLTAPTPAEPIPAPAPTPAPATPSAPESVPQEPLPSPAKETIVPPVPTPSEANTPEHHEVMAQVLAHAVQKGKDEVPATPDPLVAKPAELESWRVFKIMSEFVEGFEMLRKYGLAATFFGSVRGSLSAHFYEDASALAGKLAKSGFAIITGGSAGIMEAANKGAYEAGGASVGLNIRLDNSQGLNTYLTDSMTFEHFFVRKVMLTFASEVYVYFPGGFGTLDEFTEIITLVQTGKIRKIPIVLYGREYWEPFTKVFDERLRQTYGAIDQSDMDLYRVVDSVDEAYTYIMQATGGKDVR